LNIKPDQAFSHEVFINDPKTFFEIFRLFFLNDKKHEPTSVHKFIKELQNENILLRNYTQNIDCLELDIGIDPNLLIQCILKIKPRSW
jgi:NAD+-dependent protein deacetylase SIR2